MSSVKPLNPWTKIIGSWFLYWACFATLLVWSFVPVAACDLDWVFVVATALFLSVFNPDCASLFCLEDLSPSKVGLVCPSIEILLSLFCVLRRFVTSEVVASFLVNVCCWACVAVLSASPWLSSLSFGCDCACWLSTFGLSDVFDSIDCCCSVDLIVFGLVSFEEVFASSDLTTFECGWFNASFYYQTFHQFVIAYVQLFS